MKFATWKIILGVLLLPVVLGLAILALLCSLVVVIIWVRCLGQQARPFQLILALLLGFLGTAFFALFTVGVVWLWIGKLGRRADWTQTVPYYWGRTLESVCNRWALEQSGYEYGDRVEIGEDEGVIALVAHPTTLATQMTNKTVTDICAQLKVILKIQLAATPFGMVLDALGMAIFVDREDGGSARASLDKGLSTIKTPLAVFICPDFTRPTPDKIAKAINKMGDKIPGLGNWLKYTLYPKAGSVQKALVALGQEGIVPKIVLTWTVYTHADWGSLWDLQMVGATYHTHTYDLTQEFYQRFGDNIVHIDEKALQAWLNEVWEHCVNAGIHWCKTGVC